MELAPDWLFNLLWLGLAATLLGMIVICSRKGVRRAALWKSAALILGVLMAALVTATLWAQPASIRVSDDGNGSPGDVLCEFDALSFAFATGLDEPDEQRCVDASKMRVVGGALLWVAVCGAAGVIASGIARGSRREEQVLSVSDTDNGR